MNPDPPTLLIIGCGRSGTTVVYEALASHPDTAWFSTWSDRLRLPALAAAAPLFRWGRGRIDQGRVARLLPRPSEGYRLWDAALGMDPDAARRPLGRGDVTAAARSAVERVVAAHLRAGRGRVFVNKNTRNSRRVEALDELFGNALVLHVHRHPLDVVSSLLAVAWWPDLELWTHGGRTPRSFGPDPVRQATLAGELWLQETSQALGARTVVGDDRYLELSYEDFVADPLPVLRPVLARLGLDEHPTMARALAAASPRSVGAWRRRLDAAQASAAWAAAEPLATALGHAR